MKALTSKGIRRSTIYEVAHRAGVSIATVSRVHRNANLVAPATQDRVRRAVAELDYRPSRIGRSLAHGHHDATGIVFPDLTGPYYSEVILGYEEASAEEGQSVLILATHGRPASASQVLDLADRVDGLVLFGRTVDDGVVHALDRRGIPVVLLARPFAGSADSVRTESRMTARELTRHLLEHARARIAFLGDPSGSPDVAERWQGFKSAHRAVGRPLWRPAIPIGFRTTDGLEAARGLLSAPERPDAVMCANDEIAMGVLEAAREARIHVPTDLAVTGWDDIPAARHLTPPLTTVRQPMTDLGRRAAEFLRDRITTRRAEPLHEVLQATWSGVSS